MTVQSLAGAADAVVDDACRSLQPELHPHYSSAGEGFVRERMAGLFDLVVQALADREAVHLVRHAEEMARERFHAGFGIEEMQAFYGALEQAMWRHLAATETPEDLAEHVVALSSVLGAGKDALARVYVQLAAQRHAPQLDVDAMFGGTGSA